MDFKQVSKDYSIEKETKHWWFSTRFNFIEKSLGLIDSQKIKVIEYGCGTGQNLYFICNKSKHKNKITQLTGIDENFEWTNIWDWAKKFPKIEILKKLIKNEKYNFLICMEVYPTTKSSFFFPNLSLPFSVTRYVSPKFIANSLSESISIICIKKTLPGLIT